MSTEYNIINVLVTVNLWLTETHLHVTTNALSTNFTDRQTLMLLCF